MESDELAYRALCSRDSRFDGVFFTAVATTGIYCRPSCPARTPSRRNVRFFSTTAAARHAGYRACMRCRPDASPSSPEWNLRADLAARALRMIRDGVVDREGVAGLARRLGYSERQVHRQLRAELGVGALELAKTHRVDAARDLLETSGLAVSAVAFAAGFSSVRQFNDDVRAAFALTPSELRSRRRTRPSDGRALGPLCLRLPYRPPLDLAGLCSFLGSRALAGLESFDGTTYRRVLRLPHALGVVEVAADQRLADATLEIGLRVGDVRDLPAAVERTRHLLDLDADPLAVDERLGHDAVLRPLLAARPGLRVPGTPDGAELAVRAVLGQQVSVAAARRLGSELTRRYGEPLPVVDGALHFAFPTPAALLAACRDERLPMPRARQRALVGLLEALVDGRLDLGPGADRARAGSTLLALPGIGPWTAAYVAMRGLGDPDALPASDLGLRRALEVRGLPASPAALVDRAEAWRPWRAYGALHLWQAPSPDSTGPAAVTNLRSIRC